MKIIACATCGVERGPDVIEGCRANAKKQGLEEFLVGLDILGPGEDIAHIWVEQPVIRPQWSEETMRAISDAQLGRQGEKK
jgi:hypothetical protein